MKLLAQVHNATVILIKEYEDHVAFAPNITMVDITDLPVLPHIGWQYDCETKLFSEPKGEQDAL
ncbi:hypothetical protein SG34_010625 [Thalassomonas viridans]|uniref:Uncharacterized protein n=1 Tax=Thalassomonas viridans TaxID=137584 RepID=A0AAE9Z5Z9_9GAMM|nr:hypothetical protein [Thalassomonas viridans]WDE07300.1 hypothetical protein SG34_010625 [Thalassomonas viridans]